MSTPRTNQPAPPPLPRERCAPAAPRTPPPAPAAVRTSVVLIDTHAHYYPCYGAAPFLDAAARNLDRCAARHRAAGVPGHLVVASTASCDALALLRRHAARGPGLWRLAPLREPGCAAALHAGVPRLFLIPAHQCATAEGPEVLAIGAVAPIPDGLPLRDTVRRTLDAGAIPVIPWGLGKWSLRRGRALRDFLDSPDASRACLGDSANRPSPAPQPAPMRSARRRGTPILAGTDPLPIPRDVTLAGSYGTVLRCAYDPAHPLASLGPALLAAGRAGAPAFGRRRGPLAAAAAQLALRLARRRAGGTR